MQSRSIIAGTIIAAFLAGILACLAIVLWQAVRTLSDIATSPALVVAWSVPRRTHVPAEAELALASNAQGRERWLPFRGELPLRPM
jgi:hypothetical protein